jgi:dihydropteroate synthase
MKVVPLKIESEEEAKNLMRSLKVCPEGIKILSPKSVFAAFKIESIRSWEANIIKQHLLSLGTDAAINRDALVKNIKTSVLIFGSISQLKKLCDKLKNQPFSLKEVSQKVSCYMDNLFKKEAVFEARDKVLKITKPLICGIINVTDDSFSGDGLLAQSSKNRVSAFALKKAASMIKEGASILDLGGESSRPFSNPVSEKEEVKRIVPVLRAIRKEFKKIIISVDTYKYKVAKAAVDEGVDVINDITALRGAPKIASLIKKHGLGCVLMHMKGSPQTMQVKPKYKNTSEEIISFFEERLDFCERRGVEKNQILLDPGVGFGKRIEDNLKIIKELYKFKIFGLPIFLGLSRKSFIGEVLNAKVEDRLIGTIAASIVSVIRGANILRVHDVGETREALKMASRILSN